MTAPRLRDLLTHGTARLSGAGIETPALDAALLLGHLLGLDRAALYTRTPDVAPPGTSAAFAALIERRVRREPVAYLIGTKAFMGMRFMVNPAVLVPRPETELLIEWALRRLSSREESMRIVDVGTGSGAIAVALASVKPHARLIASDISLKALAVARSNAEQNGVAEQVSFVCGDLLSWLGHSVDVILSNLPYLTDAQADSADLRAEPRGALAGGGEDGFGLYRILIPQIPARLTPGGTYAFEIDPAQAATARVICAETFPVASVTVHHDLAGHARFVTVDTSRLSHYE